MREAIKLILDAKKTRTPIIGKAKYAEVFLEFERLCDEQEYAEPSNLNPFTDITEAFETAVSAVNNGAGVSLALDDIDVVEARGRRPRGRNGANDARPIQHQGARGNRRGRNGNVPAHGMQAYPTDANGAEVAASYGVGYGNGHIAGFYDVGYGSLSASVNDNVPEQVDGQGYGGQRYGQVQNQDSAGRDGAYDGAFSYGGVHPNENGGLQPQIAAQGDIYPQNQHEHNGASDVNGDMINVMPPGNINFSPNEGAYAGDTNVAQSSNTGAGDEEGSGIIELTSGQ